jgi:superfamily II RNA helicase
VNELLNKNNVRDVWLVVSRWANGCSFDELLELSNWQEGDNIRFFRQIVDCMSQIKKAAEDDDIMLDGVITNCLNRIYRDLIRFEFA